MPFTLNVPRLYLLNNSFFNWVVHCSISQAISDIWKKLIKVNIRNVWMCVWVVFMD